MEFGGKGRQHLIGGRPSTKAVIRPCGEEYRASKLASYLKGQRKIKGKRAGGQVATDVQKPLATSWQ